MCTTYIYIYIYIYTHMQHYTRITLLPREATTASCPELLFDVYNELVCLWCIHVSLSLSVYIYIYIHMCAHIKYTYIIRYVVCI